MQTEFYEKFVFIVVHVKMRRCCLLTRRLASMHVHYDALEQAHCGNLLKLAVNGPNKYIILYREYITQIIAKYKKNNRKVEKISNYLAVRISFSLQKC